MVETRGGRLAHPDLWPLSSCRPQRPLCFRRQPTPLLTLVGLASHWTAHPNAQSPQPVPGLLHEWGTESSAFRLLGRLQRSVGARLRSLPSPSLLDSLGSSSRVRPTLSTTSSSPMAACSPLAARPVEVCGPPWSTDHRGIWATPTSTPRVTCLNLCRPACLPAFRPSGLQAWKSASVCISLRRRLSAC